MKKQTFKKILAIICSILVVGCLFSGCAEKEPKLEEVIIGHWGYDGNIVITFYEGGTGNAEGEFFTYRVVDDKLELNIDGEIEIASVRILNENSLHLIYVDFDDADVWFRLDAQGNIIN